MIPRLRRPPSPSPGETERAGGVSASQAGRSRPRSALPGTVHRLPVRPVGPRGHLPRRVRRGTTPSSPASIAIVAPSGAGLEEEEARRRLAATGPNELPRGAGRGTLRLLGEVLREPVILLLLGATILYLIFGEPRDALVLALSVVVVIALDLYQERRAERALEALRELAAPEVAVLRSGSRRTIPAREVVPGDWVLLVEGARVPADAEVRAGTGLLVDESLLTGESVAVRKAVGPGDSAWVRPGGDDLPFVYGQTLVVRGQGWAEVRATGPRTEASQIASALVAVETETPLVRRQVRPLVLGVGAVAVVLTALLALIIGLRSGEWVLGLLAGTALAIGLLPEEIPVVTTVYSVLGARRMARHQALARRFGTIPALGCVTVLCTDKTGTLTVNRMRLSIVVPRADRPAVRLADGEAVDGEVRDLVRWAALAGEPEPTDPMEVAIVERARVLGAEGGPGLRLVDHVPFSSDLPVVRNAWSSAEGREVFVAAKGAPEHLLDLCGVSGTTRTEWEDALRQLARGGYRTLAVARSAPAPAGSDRELDPRTAPLTFVGLLGLADPLRPGVPEAIARCREAGVRVVMITGDHPETARAIAREAGLARPDGCVTGAELERLPEDELRERVRSVDLYARVRPEAKLRLVEALRAEGEIVGMTGDGVNDAPALRAAHVGIAMGRRGTDVAREAADLVLLDDAFPTVVEAVRTGRRVYENMRKALAYIVAIHVAIAGMALLPVLFGFPILLYPLEIVFLELIIDPVSSLVFEAEPEEPDVLRRPPRDPAEPILGRRAIVGSVILGASALAVSVAVYFGAIALGHPANESRALGFAALLTANVTMVLVCRSTARSIVAGLFVPNVLVWIVLAFGLSLLGAAIYYPPLASVFQFSPPPPADLGVALAAGAAGALSNDLVKRWWLPTPARRATA